MTIKISTENQNNKTYFELWLWWSYFDICIDAYNVKAHVKMLHHVNFNNLGLAFRIISLNSFENFENLAC
jgi:hypothetical protein